MPLGCRREEGKMVKRRMNFLVGFGSVMICNDL